jgi:hypothetical protein
MPKYKATFSKEVRQVLEAVVDIEAEDVDQAWELAHDLNDDSNFRWEVIDTDGGDYFDLDEVESVEDRRVKQERRVKDLRQSLKNIQKKLEKAEAQLTDTEGDDNE